MAVIGSRLYELFSVVFRLPLTVLRRVRDPWGEARVRLAFRACGCGPGRGWSGRYGGPQVQLLVLAVVAFGQVVVRFLVRGGALPAATVVMSRRGWWRYEPSRAQPDECPADAQQVAGHDRP